MNNRIFPNLVDCTIIWPHFPEALLGQSGVELPSCRTLTYDDHLLQPLGAFKLSSMGKLVAGTRHGTAHGVASNSAFSGDGSILKPRVLHLDTQSHDQHLLTTLKMIPRVEELSLGWFVLICCAGEKKYPCWSGSKRGTRAFHPSSKEVDLGVSGVDSSSTWTASLYSTRTCEDSDSSVTCARNSMRVTISFRSSGKMKR